MRNPIGPDEIVIRFTSIRQHESFCRETGAGSRFIYRKLDNGAVHVLCRLDRKIQKYGDMVDNPMFLTETGKKRSVKLTPLERRLLEMR